ncbi:hypothetical protein KAK07_02900 [Ideonella sp. 4Y16]|uniref:hypothetical protein n=1 Tax=Ideonella alba TaxID=2824118 RepID=UPI001B3669FD|nr:hypothetical protein [Ideonella alba]MBQ0942279.1 hypothetical protein [Ideonella alba]
MSALLPQWLAWLRIRHRGLAQQHADLAHDAAADLMQWLGRQDRTDFSDSELQRLGFRILQRRVADAFRAQVHDWARQDGADEPDVLSQIPDLRPGANPQQALQYARMLRALVSVLSGLTAEERGLLVGDELGGSTAPEGARSGAERERLRRLRKRVKEELIKKHGFNVQDWREE